MKIKLLDPDRRPTKKYPEDAGWDVYAGETFSLLPGERQTIGLGFCLELPPGYYARTEGKSGRAKYEGITTIGNIIDSTYRGECHATVVNLSKQQVTVLNGDKVCQLLICPVVITELEEVIELSPSDRGDKGHGSTGL